MSNNQKSRFDETTDYFRTASLLEGEACLKACAMILQDRAKSALRPSRGRPSGSKNKPKAEETQAAAD